MSKSEPQTVMGLDPESIMKLREVRAKRDAGEAIDPQSEEALKAIDLASKVVNTIMAGGQVDPVFLKQFINDAEFKLNFANRKSEKPKVKKKRRFKRK